MMMAVTFENPALLAAVPCAALPAVIGLLLNSRAERRAWGAMIFLDAAGDGLTMIRRRQRFVIALRALCILALVITFAGPTVAGSERNASDRKAALILVIDRSGSTALPDLVNRTRLDAIVKAALDALALLPSGSTVATVFMPPVDNAEPRWTSDLQSAAVALHEVRPANNGRADVVQGLTTVDQLLKNRASTKRTKARVLLICDRQASSWRGVNSVTAAGLMKEGLGELSGGVFVVAPVGTLVKQGNLAIVSAEPDEAPLISGCSSIFSVKISNFGSERQAHVPVSIRSRGRQIASAEATIEARSSAALHVPITLQSTGDTVVTAKITDDGLSSDDTFDEAVEVIHPIDLIALPESKRLVETFRTLSNSHQLRPTSMSALKDALQHRPCIILLTNPDEIDDSELRDVDQRVRDGATLLIALAANSDRDSYNRRFWQQGTGLSPAMLSAADVEASKKSTTAQPFADRLETVLAKVAELPNLEVMRLAGISRESHILISTDPASPLLIERAYGKGTVALLSAALPSQPEKGTAAAWGELLRSVSMALINLAMVDRNIALGSPIIVEAIEPKDPVAHVTGPGGFAEDVTLAKRPAHWIGRSAPTVRSGVYRVRYSNVDGPVDELFSVRQQREESDTSDLSELTWHQLKMALGFNLLSSAGGEDIAAALGLTRGHWRLAPAVAAVSIGAAAVDVLLLALWLRPIKPSQLNSIPLSPTNVS